MRRLIYVPIIHTDADMGSLASALEQSTAVVCGQERWEKHKDTAFHFWQMVSDYLKTLAAQNLKVYQDGFVSDGDLGKKVIEEAARKGSKNYETILALLNRGAEIVSTEDVALLQEEYGLISRIIKAKTSSQRRLVYKEYESRKSQLIMERDKFIARTINETLESGEEGLLFIGVCHDVVSHLAEDIAVEQLKEREKIKSYFDELIYGSDEKNFDQLAGYLKLAVGAGGL